MHTFLGHLVDGYVSIYVMMANTSHRHQLQWRANPISNRACYEMQNHSRTPLATPRPPPSPRNIRDDTTRQSGNV